MSLESVFQSAEETAASFAEIYRNRLISLEELTKEAFVK